MESCNCMTKILHLLSSNQFSGAENVACQIIDNFNEGDFDSIYCSPKGNIAYSLRERKIKSFLIEKMSLSEVKRAIKTINPDIIHAHDMRASLFAAIVCGNKPLICHIHNNSLSSRKISIKTLGFLIASKKAKHIFWVSNSAFNCYVFKKQVEKKSTVLYNIINVKKLQEKVELDKNTYDYDVIFLGRMTAPKNPIRLLNVFECLVTIKPNIKLAIVGTGEMDAEVHKIASQKNLENNIKFFGFVKNPYKILKDSKVMIMTSVWEGTPMCALEAMALGVPIISTPTDGLKDLIIDGETGYLSDSDDSLVNYIVELIDNKDKRAIFSENSCKRANSLMNTEQYKNAIYKEYLNCL